MERVGRQQAETILVRVEMRRAALLVPPGADAIAVRASVAANASRLTSGDAPSIVVAVLTALKKPVDVRIPGRQTRCAMPGQRAIMPPQMILIAKQAERNEEDRRLPDRQFAQRCIRPASGGMSWLIVIGKVDWARVAKSTQKIVVPISQSPTRTEVKNHQTRSRATAKGERPGADVLSGSVVWDMGQTPLFASTRREAPSERGVARHANRSK